jgi:hypothetical protein
MCARARYGASLNSASNRGAAGRSASGNGACKPVRCKEQRFGAGVKQVQSAHAQRGSSKRVCLRAQSLAAQFLEARLLAARFFEARLLASAVPRSAALGSAVLRSAFACKRSPSQRLVSRPHWMGVRAAIAAHA